MLSVVYARLRFAAEAAAEAAALRVMDGQQSPRPSTDGSKKHWVAPDQVGGVSGAAAAGSL